MGWFATPARGARRYGLAAGAVLLATGVRVTLLGVLETHAPFVTFYPAVIVSALYGGWSAGLLATVLSAVTSSLWFDLSGAWGLHHLSDWVAMIAFVVSGAAISWICDAMRRAQAKAAEAAAEARAAIQREEAAAALLETAEHAQFLARIIESSEQPLAVGYPDGRLGICNRAYCDLTGYSAEELRQLSWTEALTPAHCLPAELEALAELERTGKPVRYQKEYIRKDGRTVPIELLVHVARDAAGKVQYYYSFVTDITERLRAESELRRQREWLRVTLSSIGDAVLAADTAGAVTFLNPVAAALTGWKEAEALGRPSGEVFRIINEQSRENGEDIVARVLREGQSVLLANHTALLSRDGKETPIEDSAAPIRDSNGSVTGVVVVFHDVTERRRGQHALERSEAQLRTILETLNEGIVVSTLDGDLYLWNRSAIEIHGFATLEECRRKLPEFSEIFELSTLDGAVLPLEEWPLARILRGDRLRDLEIRIRRREGDWQRILNYGGALVRDGEGKPILAVVTVVDITGKKQGERALRESEALLRSVGDNLPEGAIYRYISEPEGSVRFEFVSAGIERMVGVPPDEITAHPEALHHTVVPEDMERLRVAEEVSREGLSPFEIEIRQVHRATGAIRWSLLRSMPRRREGGTTVWDGVQLDITGQKQLEAQLRQHVEELRTVMEVVPVGIWVAHDPQCQQIVGNRMANEFYEAGPGENVSANITPVRRFFHRGRELAPEELPMQEAAARGVDVRHSELEVLLPSGRQIHMLGHASPLRDETGQIRGCVGAFLDITERKVAEEALRRSEAVYRAIARNIPGGTVAVVDKELRYSVVDGSLLARLGIRPELMEGRPVAEAVPNPGMSQTIVDLYRRALAGESVDFEQTWKGRELACRFVPLRDERGEVVGAMSLWLDVTERKRNEERLRQSQKLESIGLLAGGIAHDFNNLLTAIMGSASLLIDDEQPEVAEVVRSIVASAEKAAHLTRQLLAYSGKGQFILKELHLTRVVREMADLLRLSIPRSIELRFDLAEQLPHIVMDPGQLQQILMNLVINGGEAIPGGIGRLSVTTGVCDVGEPFVDALGDEAPPGRYVCLEVADTGGGMTPDTVERIFDPFFTTKFTGRGLGLAAVSGIVRSQNAAITVDSAPGKGSTFRVFFRAARTDQVPDRVPSRGTVLVVDDEESVRGFVSAALVRAGYRTWQAADGMEALAVCDREKDSLDAVVLDIVMPVMGGSDALPEILRRRPGVRVLLTSGFSETEAKRLCSSYEGAAFIQKPYTAQTLVSAVQDVLRKQ